MSNCCNTNKPSDRDYTYSFQCCTVIIKDKYSKRAIYDKLVAYDDKKFTLWNGYVAHTYYYSNFSAITSYEDFIVELLDETTCCDNSNGGTITSNSFEATHPATSVANGQGVLADLAVPGLLLSKPTVAQLSTNLSAFPGLIVTGFVIANNTFRIWVEYQGGPTINLPAISFQITQFDL